MSGISDLDTFLTLGGRVRCLQCNAMSKRTRFRCGAPAIKGKNKCRFHGGKSTGSRTTAGKARQIAANTKHGNETRAKRDEYRAKMKEIYELEELERAMGMIVGPKTAGRKN